MSVGTTDLTGANVMDRVAALMNDTAKTTYTYNAQIPYVNMAFDELQEEFERNNVPVTNQQTVVIEVPKNTIVINPSVGPGDIAVPNYPVDLIEIQQLWERLNGTNDPFVPMTPRDFLPHYNDDQRTNNIGVFTWQDQRIKFIAPLTDREVKIDYIKALFQAEIVSSTAIGIINARSFLYYRTAALCSQFIGENETRANELNKFAKEALDRTLGISTKGRQAIVTRRRPFMSAYRNR